MTYVTGEDMKLKWFDEAETEEMEEFCKKNKIIDVKVITQTYSTYNNDLHRYTGEIGTSVSYLVLYD